VCFALRRRSVWAVRQNGLSAFLSAAAADERKAAVDGPDPVGSVALALGWHAAELYRSLPSARIPARDDGLPGVSMLSVDDPAQIGLDQLLAGANKLQGAILAAKRKAPDALGLQPGSPRRRIRPRDRRRSARLGSGDCWYREPV
jgi:hypothetical protein